MIRIFRPFLEALEDRLVPDACGYDALGAAAEPYALAGYGKLNVAAGATVYFSLSVSAPAEGMSDGEVQDAVVEGLGHWARYIPLNYQQVVPGAQPPGSAYVPISVSPIDGELGILGVTYVFGPSRSVTIDADGPWTTDPAFATDRAPPVWMVKVIMHEWGHVLGLAHQEDPSIPAVMAPTYRGSPADLSPDDIAGARALFGAGTGTVHALARPVERPFPVESVGVFDPATNIWHLSGNRQDPVWFGPPGCLPVTGDWDGNGTDTVGVFDPRTATWYLKNVNSQGTPDVTPFAYGAPGWIPVVGDWDGNGTWTVGVVDPATMTWYLRNSNTPGAPDVTPFRYGAAGDRPLAGDWDGTGWSKPAVYSPTTGVVTEAVLVGLRAVPLEPDATPVAGPWDNGKKALLGFVRRAHWSLLFPDRKEAFDYGEPGWLPVVGRWGA